MSSARARAVPTARDVAWCAGLVSKVVANDQLMTEALALANKIAANSLPSS